MASTPADAGLAKVEGELPNQWLIIGASSLGTVFEWYDFYLYGLVAAVISAQFFSGVSDATGFFFALTAFAAGFAVRPFGALVFGRLGDLVGRKHTFLITMGIMGLSTFAVGCLPSYKSVGMIAPIALLALRLLQGLALGGEYGGAATYVAEFAPPGKRGFYTSFIQCTATLGLFAALLVVIGCRVYLGEDAFKEWGWRIPFWVSAILLAVSMWIRMQLAESPVFLKMKSLGTTSKAPLSEAFGRWSNLKIVLISLLGAVMGQAVVWYTGQFYALYFLERTIKVDSATTNILIAIALVLATPGFVFFGWLSDRIGRKPIIMAGCLLAALTYFPLFHALTEYANPALYAAQNSAPVTVVADPNDCSFQFDPIGKKTFDSEVLRHREGLPGEGQRDLQERRRARRHAGANPQRQQRVHGAGSQDRQRRGQESGDRCISKGSKGCADGSGISGQGGPGPNQQAHGGSDSVHLGAVRDHGVRTHRGHAG